MAQNSGYGGPQARQKGRPPNGSPQMYPNLDAVEGEKMATGKQSPKVSSSGQVTGNLPTGRGGGIGQEPPQAPKGSGVGSNDNDADSTANSLSAKSGFSSPGGKKVSPAKPGQRQGGYSSMDPSMNKQGM